MNFKKQNGVGFIITLLLIASALLLQWYYHLKPCPLCIMQRVVFIAIAMVFFIFIFMPPRFFWMRLQGLLLFLIAGTGFGIALRQIYLQHLPAGEAPACGPGLSYLFSTVPWNQAFILLFQGSGECAVVDWRFLSFSMAEWSALWLLFFCCCGLFLLFKKRM